MTFADIPESRIGVRDDWETASGAIEQTKKVIIKKCGISLPKVRDDLCQYSLDAASERGMTFADIPEFRIGVRDDWVTTPEAIG